MTTETTQTQEAVPKDENTAAAAGSEEKKVETKDNGADETATKDEKSKGEAVVEEAEAEAASKEPQAAEKEAPKADQPEAAETAEATKEEAKPTETEAPKEEQPKADEAAASKEEDKPKADETAVEEKSKEADATSSKEEAKTEAAKEEGETKGETTAEGEPKADAKADEKLTKEEEKKDSPVANEKKSGTGIGAGLRNVHQRVHNHFFGGNNKNEDDKPAEAKSEKEAEAPKEAAPKEADKVPTDATAKASSPKQVTTNSDDTIRKILTETRTIALVGASTQFDKPSNQVMTFMIQRGYHVIPVNPTAVGTKIHGVDIVASLKDIQEPVDMVHVFRKAEEAPQIVEDAIAIKAKSVWLQVGIVSDEAGEKARAAGLDFVQNICPRVEISRLDIGLVNNDHVTRRVLTETRTIALVGASSNPDRPSNQVMKFMMLRGYHVIPVNPVAAGTKILGQEVVASLKDIQEPVDLVHVFRRAEEAPQIVYDAIAIGAKSVWLQVGIVNNKAGEWARAGGLMFVQDVCPRVEIPRLGVGLITNDHDMREILTETKTVALVGASSNPERASNQVMEFMMQRGYYVIPVNPGAVGTKILGQDVVASMTEIAEPVDMVQVFRRSEEATKIVEDAITINAKSVWLQPGIVNNEAGEKARAAGLMFAQDVCPRAQIPRLSIGLVNNEYTICKVLTETKTIALVGASAETNMPANYVMNFLLERGFDVMPVNPEAAGTKILGRTVVGSIKEIGEPIDMVLMCRPSEEVGTYVEHAIDVKAKSVWLPLGVVNDEAGLKARAAGLDFVQNLCPREELRRLGFSLQNNSGSIGASLRKLHTNIHAHFFPQAAKGNAPNTDHTIRQILTDTKTIALIGANSGSEQSSDFVMDFLIRQGYHVIPVNPDVPEGAQILGQEVVASLADIKEPIDMVHIFRRSEEAVPLVEEAIRLNAKGVWLQTGVISDEAGKRATEAGLKFVQNKCPKAETERLGLGLVNNGRTICKILTETKTIALIGANPRPEMPANFVMDFMMKQGYKVIPVEESRVGAKILGQDVVASIKDIKEPIDMVMVFRSGCEAGPIVDKAIEAKAKSVWLTLGMVNDDAGRKARAAGLSFVQNVCPREELRRLRMRESGGGNRLVKIFQRVHAIFFPQK